MAVEVKAVVKQLSGSTSEGSVRSHTIRCDRPETKGGNDGGAMGGELFLIGLGGCFMSNLLAAIQSRESEIKDPAVAINGQLDGTPPRFTEIELEISAATQDKEELEKLVTIAERGCIVANTIKDSVALNIRVS